jgi:oligosaccharide repeat unit polymerase
MIRVGRVGAGVGSARNERSAAAVRNPFFAIHPLARAAVAGYFFFYFLLFPAINAMADPTAQELLYPRVAAQALYVVLLAAPFVFVRNGGWLHPLFLLPLVNTISSALKDPLAILDPLRTAASSTPALATHGVMVSFSVATSSIAGSLAVPVSELARARLMLTLLYCFGLAVYYAAYSWGRTFPLPRFEFVRPRRIRVVSVGVVTLSVFVAAYVIAMSGGLSEHILRMRGGRQEMFQGVGPLLVLTTFAPFMVLIWFAYEDSPFSKPLFVVTAVVAALVPLLTTGSRSSVILPLAALIVLWWHKRGRILVWPTVGVLLVTLAVMGGFGALRRDFSSNVVDWSMLSPQRVGEWFDGGTSEMTARSAAEADLAAFVGARSKGLLTGRTYVNTLFFWLPRGLWPDKPRSAGTYNMWINYANAELNEPPPDGSVWGIPVSYTVEAFWNFHLAGVALLALLMGVFHRTLVGAAVQYAAVPAALPIIVYMTIRVTGGGQSLTTGVRDMLLIYLALKVMGALSNRRSSPSVRLPMTSGVTAG